MSFVVHSVRRTHSIVRLRTRIRRKDGSENFGGFVYEWDEFPQRDFLLWAFMCPNNITLFFDSMFASILRLFCVSSTATTPRATTLHLYCKGYHAFTTHCTATTPVYLYPGYHATVPTSISGLSHLSYHAPPHT